MTNEPKPYFFLAAYEIGSPATNVAKLHERLKAWGASEVMPHVWIGHVDPHTLASTPEVLKSDLCERLDPVEDKLLLIGIEGLFSLQGCGPEFHDFLKRRHFSSFGIH